MRKAGILMPIFSLPSKYGIGSLSEEAYKFIDFLANAGQKYWQILPLGPTGLGDSPYQSHSTFAGNPNLIDLEYLMTIQLLYRDEVERIDWGNDRERVDYGKVVWNKKQLLMLAYQRFMNESKFAFNTFCDAEKHWLDDYANYMSKKEGVDPNYYKFEQMIFYHQWYFVKSYANSRGIEIIGDLPIYVSLDSADTVNNLELFQLEDGRPKAVAGCPPDVFSEDGQVWGNPLYDWNKHKETEFKWWVSRIKHCFKLYDVVRIDHFRGMADYFSIPYGANNARNGHWEDGPGMALFDAVKRELGDVKIIAEDLGILSPKVYELLKDSGYPGMKILHFAFNSGDDNPYLPGNISENYIVYTGTHDNDTTVGWLNKLHGYEKEHFERYVVGENKCWGLIELAMSTRANTCIIPIQDYLELDSSARVNIPGTFGNNWNWRLKEIPNNELAERIKQVTIRHGR